MKKYIAGLLLAVLICGLSLVTIGCSDDWQEPFMTLVTQYVIDGIKDRWGDKAGVVEWAVGRIEAQKKLDWILSLDFINIENIVSKAYDVVWAKMKTVRHSNNELLYGAARSPQLAAREATYSPDDFSEVYDLIPELLTP